nr:hypothetical protein [Tanacetum cinerariifolium]
KEEAQEEDGDDRDSYDMWDIMIEDVEWIRKFLTPNVPDVIDDVTQPLIPKAIHTTPPDEDYVAPATQSILDELLEEFGNEILNVTMVDEGVDFNPTNDIEELERLLAKDPQSHFVEIQVLIARKWNSRSLRLVIMWVKSDLEKEEAQEEDGDDRDSYDMWDIMIEDVEWIRKFLTPNVPDVIDDVTQPLIPKAIHTTSPDEDYVAPATQSILDELLEEFGNEILNVTMVDEGVDFNPTNDIEDLERLLAKDPQSHFVEIQ